VTPSFNQGQFLEETIRSVLLQGYPHIEYFVLDGGSKDQTIEVLQKYSRWLSFWTSEPDGGQSTAINRGLRMGSGVYATWINSDDLLFKNAVANFVQCANGGQDVVYIGDCIHIDEAGETLLTHRGRVSCFEDLVRIRSIWHSNGWIDQPGAFFPLELILRVGGLNEKNHLTMDYELWGQFLLSGAEMRYIGIPTGIFRTHQAQKTQQAVKQTESMIDAALALLERPNPLSEDVKREILTDLYAYREEYPKRMWKGSGRLARIGLPPSIVEPVRTLRNAIKGKFANGSK
jgi:hypothetical protein